VAGNFEKLRQDIFEVIPVTDLPRPHNPSKCTHRARFDAILAELGSFGRSGHSTELEAGRRFLRTLTSDDTSACWYHQPDWKEIADRSAGIIESVGRQDPRAYLAAAAQENLPAADLRWLVSVFDNPIQVRGDSYVNGQHRGCALRFSGADRAAVVTGSDVIAEVCTDWAYLGDG
jgi:hypothetical protein